MVAVVGKVSLLVQPRTLSLERSPARRGPSGTASAPGSLLDVFVYGPENASLEEIFSTAGIHELASRSPIYLYGPRASGKSSLAYALAARYGRHHRTNQVIVSDGLDFARALAAAIDADDMERFRRRYRDAALLVIDGLQDMVAKVHAQDELVVTLDYRNDQRLPTVITALTLPHSIRGIRPALASRCIAGLSSAISFPGPAARQRLVELIARKLEVRLSAGELEQVMLRSGESISVPELQGLLLQWLHQARVEPARTLEPPAESLRKLLEAQQQAKIPSLAEIAKTVARESGLKLADLRGVSRRSQIVRARSLSMYLARLLTPLSFQQIGDYFGRRDHTTVMHACRKLQVELETDIELSRLAEEIQRQLR